MTYVANSLVILAVSPFLAAVLAWVLLRERVRRATVICHGRRHHVVSLPSWRPAGSGPSVIYGDLLALLGGVRLRAFQCVHQGGAPQRHDADGGIGRAACRFVVSCVPWC